MPRLRHLAMVVEDIEKTAKFYEHAFGMQRMRQHATAIGLSDGTVSLVLISPDNPNVKGDAKRGLHHIGFLIEDMDETAAKLEANGARYHGEILGVGTGPQGERKYLDPNGVMFDITTAAHARETWRIKVEEEATTT
jgi:catechol 2,3-dioxygenase-like lactoylglutathione lyase family enzyme